MRLTLLCLLAVSLVGLADSALAFPSLRGSCANGACAAPGETASGGVASARPKLLGRLRARLGR